MTQQIPEGQCKYNVLKPLLRHCLRTESTSEAVVASFIPWTDLPPNAMLFAQRNANIAQADTVLEQYLITEAGICRVEVVFGGSNLVDE